MFCLPAQQKFSVHMASLVFALHKRCESRPGPFAGSPGTGSMQFGAGSRGGQAHWALGHREPRPDVVMVETVNGHDGRSVLCLCMSVHHTRPLQARLLEDGTGGTARGGGCREGSEGRDPPGIADTVRMRSDPRLPTSRRIWAGDCPLSPCRVQEHGKDDIGDALQVDHTDVK